MKKLIYLCVLAIGFTSCSVESLDSTENLIVADAKMKMQQVDKSMHLKAVEICEGDAPVFVFDFPQDNSGNSGNTKDTDIHIQWFNTVTSDWETLDQISYAGAGPEEYTYDDEVLVVGTYDFRAKIGAGGFDYTATLNVIDCSDCEESFSYNPNEDGSYTFTYIPEEDMTNAEVVFTFAQGVTISGLENWTSEGITKQTSMDFEACKIYIWTVGLDVNCGGVGQPNANLWTDFKVNDDSKKGELKNIVKSCN